MSVDQIRRPHQRAVATFRRVWRSSLPLRVIVSTLVASVVVVLLGGQFFLNRARNGIVASKKQGSIVEASTALQRMQTQLDDTDLRTESLLERLGQLADEVGSQPGQFSVIIETTASVYMSRGVMPASVPQTLRDEMSMEPRQLYVTLTDVRYDDGSSEPGVVVGGHLVAPSGQMSPVYFLFPAHAETQTLQVLRRALWLTGALLLAALAIIAFTVMRQVTVPLRAARDVAGRIAGGDLDQRMQVRGTDEMASLATSMNNMAAELQRQISQLEDLSRVQQQFVSDVSHELRTPLTTMRMATEVLHESRDRFSPDLRRTVELLHDQEERFELMLGDLLEISRFDAGAAVLNLEEVDLADLVSAEVTAQEAVARRFEVPIELVIEGSTIVEADPRRIQRILRNLLNNALGHAERRPVTITVAGDDQAVAVTVRDRGVGFAPSQSDQVFRRFWRADEVATGSAAPGWGWRSRWRTPGCTRAGCRPGDAPAGCPVPADRAAQPGHRPRPVTIAIGACGRRTAAGSGAEVGLTAAQAGQLALPATDSRAGSIVAGGTGGEVES